MNCGSEGPGGVCLTVLCRQGCFLQVYRSLEDPGGVCEAVFCNCGVVFYR